MSTPQELQTAPIFLMQAIQGDLRLSLAHVTAWLDPLRLIDPDLLEEAYYDGAHVEDPDSLALYALSVARRCFPAAYCDMVEGLRAGWGFSRLESAFFAGVSRVYLHIELGSLYDMVYGIPLPFAGLEITSPEFLDDRPDYAALLTDYFNLSPTPYPATRWRSPYSAIDDNQFDAMQLIARCLITSLIAQDSQPYADLAFLLMYLFSCTGNTLLDFSANDYWETGYEPLAWEPDMLEMADEACQELVIVLDAVERAMKHLVEDEELSNTLKTNIAALKAAERMENVSLNWPERPGSRGTEPGDPGDSGAHAALVFLRGAFAKAD